MKIQTNNNIGKDHVSLFDNFFCVTLFMHTSRNFTVVFKLFAQCTKVAILLRKFFQLENLLTDQKYENVISFCPRSSVVKLISQCSEEALRQRTFKKKYL